MSAVPLDQAFQIAFQLQQSNRPQEARAVYEQIVAQHPRHFPSLHMLGVLCYQAGEHERALDLLRRAIDLDPASPTVQANYGLVLAARGQLDQAIDSYRKALSLRSDLPEVHHNLAFALAQFGATQEAIAAYRKAIALRPTYPQAWNNLGNVLQDAGQTAEAIDAFKRAISLQPTNAEAHNNVGSALLSDGRADEAIESFRAALSIRPVFPQALVNLGSALLARERAEEAIAAFQRALALQSDYSEAWCGLGNALQKQERHRESIEAFRHAIALRPTYTAALNNLGNVLLAEGQADEAASIFRRLVTLQPDLPEPHSNLGNALLVQGQVEEAIDEFNCAIALRPDYAQAHSNLANALGQLRQFDLADAGYRRAMELSPDYADARWNLALLQLLRGNYAEGWQNYEARRDTGRRIFHRTFDQPLWDVSDLNGRRILLHAEQGFGDAIQFVRYVPLVADRGGQVILHCQPELHLLFQTVRGVQQVITGNDPLPQVDLQCPLITLPLRFGTTLETIPHQVPYLRADQKSIDHWHERLGQLPGNLKVGIAWSGSPGNTKNRERSIDPIALQPLLCIPGITFVSLQKNTGNTPSGSTGSQLNFVDWTNELTDFADTAALIDALDLVITIDTAVAHLAGALARPVWVLLSYTGDWRYLLDRPDSPWYPTMRLFRQPRRGDWNPAINAVARDLDQLNSNP